MSSITSETIDTKSCGKIQVYIMGHLHSGGYILTLHDLGCNENEMINFVQHGAMDLLATSITWVHAVVPGQGDGEPDLDESYRFPTMQMLAEGMAEVCDTLGLNQVVVFGEGAGANILVRLAMIRDDLVVGAVLIHCTGTTAGLVESVRDKIISWKLNTVGMNPYAESYLLFHRFGTVTAGADEAELTQCLALFRKSLKDSINPRNLNKFITSFMARSKIIEKVDQLRCPVMFLTGTRASHNHTVHRLYSALLTSVKDKPDRLTKLDLVQLEGVANVLKEAPEKVAECLQLFIQGLGLAGSVVNRRMSTTLPQGAARSRSLSMEEYDQPKGVSVCVFDSGRKYSSAFNEGDEVKQEVQTHM